MYRLDHGYDAEIYPHELRRATLPLRRTMVPVESVTLPTLAARIGKSIVLVGLMGAGKTVVGRRLAKRLGLPFVDADDEIVKAAGCSIEDIFATRGESTFREGERRVVARLLQDAPRVVATGGGAFMDAGTRSRIREGAVSVWLRADLDILEKRTRGRSGRPLLKGRDPRTVLASLMAERYPVYAEADVTVESTEEPPEVTVERIVRALGALASPGEDARP
jgi:shikimate kinase